MSLTLDNLTFSYGRRAVLKGVDASWETGQMVGLLGPNGAGKSTLVTCVAQLRRYLGEVTFEGRRGRDLRGMIGYMPQGLPGDAALTALESVLTASRRGMTWHTSRADIDLAWGALDELGVAELADRPLGQLSGGQRQLVALAQTLVREPGLILLDEPTSALDLCRQVSVLSHVRRICHRDTGRLAVVALHDLNLAARFCDRLAVLAGGTVLAEGRPPRCSSPIPSPRSTGCGCGSCPTATTSWSPPRLIRRPEPAARRSGIRLVSDVAGRAPHHAPAY